MRKKNDSICEEAEEGGEHESGEEEHNHECH